jgi:hypothetical protein
MGEQVNVPRREYLDYSEDWRKLRDVHAGARAIKAAGPAYLPKLDGQDPQQYQAYETRALWFGAFPRTVAGLAGAIARKPAAVSVPEPIRPHLTDLTTTGQSLDACALTIVKEVLIVGRAGALIDLPSKEDTRPRPYWTMFATEQIVNWHSTTRAGVTTLELVVLRQQVSEASADRFHPSVHEQYLVLELIDGRYRMQVWRDVPGRGLAPIREVWPTRRGTPLSFIPFAFFSPTGNETEPQKPPLLDLAEVNLSHYRSSADLEHGRHYTALPVPWVTGAPTSQSPPLRIGSAVAWMIQSPEARVGMLEFTGQGLGALERALETKEKLMAVLGARLLETQKLGIEAADTVRLRQSGDSAVLAGLALAVSAGLSQLLRIHAWWAGLEVADQNISVDLNRDFFDAPLSSAELDSLVATWQAGGISYETLYWNLQRGEIARPGVAVEQERVEIQAEDRSDFPRLVDDDVAGVDEA